MGGPPPGGRFHGGCAPHSLFGLAQKENAPRPVEEKKALSALRCSGPPRDGGRRIGASADLGWPTGTLSFSARSILPSRGGWCGGRRGGRRIELLLFALPLAVPRGSWRNGRMPSPYGTAPTPARVARSEAERAEGGVGQMRFCTPIFVGTRAAGIRCQIRTAPRRARREAIANPQASSHADPRTATLHACAKLRPKRLFLLHRARRVLFFGQTKKRTGGASASHPHGCFLGQWVST